MNHPEAWTRIKEVAERRRDASARVLADMMRRANAAQQQLILLREYRLDYGTRLQHASRDGVGSGCLRNYQKFLANLEEAITLQIGTIASLEQAVAQARREVNGEQRRAESYRIIDDRRSSEASVRERRRAQGLQDEMAIRVVAQSVANGES